LITLIFVTVPSPAYADAVHLAMQAAIYEEVPDGRRTRHVATFQTTQDELATLAALWGLIREWQGVSVDIDGVPILPRDRWRIDQIVEQAQKTGTVSPEVRPSPEPRPAPAPGTRRAASQRGDFCLGCRLPLTPGAPVISIYGANLHPACASPETRRLALEACLRSEAHAARAHLASLIEDPVQRELAAAEAPLVVVVRRNVPAVLETARRLFAGEPVTVLQDRRHLDQLTHPVAGSSSLRERPPSTWVRYGFLVIASGEAALRAKLAEQSLSCPVQVGSEGCGRLARPRPFVLEHPDGPELHYDCEAGHRFHVRRGALTVRSCDCRKGSSSAPRAEPVPKG
jgi:hypothetical protein